jgi:hypothetical protein
VPLEDARLVINNWRLGEYAGSTPVLAAKIFETFFYKKRFYNKNKNI